MDRRLYVKKEINPVIGEQETSAFFFFPSSSPGFVKTGKASKNLRYQDQMGYIECQYGFVKMVMILPRARKCGIGTDLTELCMIDPQLKKHPQTKEVDEFRKKEPTIVSTLETGCSSFIGLLMAARPIKGANAYFSAAMKTGYNKLYVSDNFGQYGWMDTSDAKSRFDAISGTIGDQPASLKHWWFCKEIPGKFPCSKVGKLCNIL